jgi:hypothetical protein
MEPGIIIAIGVSSMVAIGAGVYVAMFAAKQRGGDQGKDED